MYPEDFDDLLINDRAEYEALDPQIKVAYCLHRLEAEVNNGGFHQFFSNFSGQFARETIEALDGIGARKTSELLKRAIKVCFPSGYPNDPDQCEEYVAEYDDIEDEIEALNNTFLEYIDPLADQVNEYLDNGT